MHTVAILLYDGMRVFDYAVATEIWGIDRVSSGVPPFTVWHCAQTSRAVSTDMPTKATPSHGLRRLARADLVIVPGSARPLEPPAEAVATALRKAHKRGVPIVALCGGTFVLAYAGLLDGRRATTHWLWADHLRRSFPRVRLEQESLFVGDGQVWTSAGTSAGIDLGLHLVRQAHGAKAAVAIARRMVTSPNRPGDQRQYIEIPVPTMTTSSDFLARAMAWAAENLDQELTVTRLAAHAHMSSRTFARRFGATVGTTPARWIRRQRVQLAQRLLEETVLSIDAIARHSGLVSGQVLRHHFAGELGITPTAYRKAFASLHRS